MDGNGFDALTRRLATGRSRRSVLKGLIGGGAAVLAAGAGSTLAKPSPDKKVTVCHSDADTGQYYEISIATKALSKHLQNNRGDYEGACAVCTPVHCQYSGWSPSSECSVACGGGTQTYTRVVTVPASCDGTPCTESLEQTQECNTQACCEDIPCPDGFCGPQLNTCGQEIGYCVDSSVTCPDGFCGNLYDACDNQIGYCVDYSVTCDPNACGSLYDTCGNYLSDCSGGCNCVPDPIDCGTQGFCGSLYDSCGEYVGECTPPGCEICAGYQQSCTPGVSYCCGNSFPGDGCALWGDCGQDGEGSNSDYCC